MMQGFSSFKYGERRNDWRCCFCCHVRTATILLGVWHLMFHVVALLVIAIVLRNPNLLVDTEDDPTSLPALQSNVAPTRTYGNFVNYQELNVGVVITFSTFIITFLMVYGAIKGKPSFLMPFFCLQVFDFCISSLTALSWLCYLPNIHRLVEDNSQSVPFHSELLNLSPKTLSLIVLIVFTTVILLKGYFIEVVWSCYKYLTLRSVAGERTVHLVEPHQRRSLLNPADQYHKFPTPPPSYADATANIHSVP